MKEYLLQLLQACAEEKFGQDAIEWAIVMGHVPLTYQLAADVRAVMGEDGANYDRIIEAYRRATSEHGGALVSLYESSGLLEEILRPVSTTRATITLPARELQTP